MWKNSWRRSVRMHGDNVFGLASTAAIAEWRSQGPPQGVGGGHVSEQDLLGGTRGHVGSAVIGATISQLHIAGVSLYVDLRRSRSREAQPERTVQASPARGVKLRVSIGGDSIAVKLRSRSSAGEATLSRAS